MNSDNKTETIKNRKEDIKWLEDFLSSLGQAIVKKEAASISSRDKVGAIVSDLQATADIGNQITDLIDGLSHSEQTVHTISSGFHFSSSFLSAVNFIKTPVEYLYAWIKGETVRDTYSKSARWAQSLMVMSLGALAFFIPAGGPAFALGAVFIGLGASIISLSNLYFNKSLLQDKLKKNEVKIKNEEKVVNEINEILSALNNPEADSINTDFELTSDKKEIFEKYRQNLRILRAEKLQLESELKEKGPMAVMDRVVSIGISSLMVIALTLSITASPLGPALITISGAIGAFYMITRVAPSLFKKISSWMSKIKSWSESAKESEAAQKTLGMAVQPVVTESETPMPHTTPIKGQSSSSSHTFFEPAPEKRTDEVRSEHIMQPSA